MSFTELLAWAWREASCVHMSHSNLLIHIVAVPLFVLGHIVLVAGVFISPWLCAVAILGIVVSLGAQNMGHSLAASDIQTTKDGLNPKQGRTKKERK